MLRRLAFSAIVLAGVLAAQITPKQKPEDYPAHVMVASVGIGAEDLGHSLMTADNSVFIRDYLVIEVAIFARDNKPVKVSANHFTLRINGQKVPLQAQTPGMVAASVMYPDWTSEPQVEAQAGPVIIGRTQPVERFPGDNRPYENRVPNPAPTTDPDSRGVQKRTVTAEDTIEHSALPEGLFREPVNGCLFFGHPAKKMKSIKSLELIYDGPLGSGTLRLR